MEDTNAFSALNQLILPQMMVSPSKQQENQLLNDKLIELMRSALQSTNNHSIAQLPTITPIPLVPQTLAQMPVAIQTSPSNESVGDLTLKASPSASSDVSSFDGDITDQIMMMQQQNFQNPLQQLNIDSSANIAASGPVNAEQRLSGRHDTWMECFTTTQFSEYEALLFSVYVTERTDRKFDGWSYFDCLHRLQSKCRYRVRAKKQTEFYIIEEKGVHNHGAVEPVGQAGSHAGLPKTIREIVDRSYNENWQLEVRNMKVDEEIKRLGLPANPRLGRQIDNRVAYLRRVKNLHETRRIQDQVNGSIIKDPSMLTEAMLNPAMLQALMDQNGGSLTVEKGLVEQLLGPHTVAGIVSQQNEQKQPVAQLKNSEEHATVGPNAEFYEFLKQQQIDQALDQQQLQQGVVQQMQENPQQHSVILAQAQQKFTEGQENVSQ